MKSNEYSFIEMSVKSALNIIILYHLQAPEGEEEPEKLPIADEGGEETKIPMEQCYTDDYDQYTEGNH